MQAYRITDISGREVFQMLINCTHRTVVTPVCVSIQRPCLRSAMGRVTPHGWVTDPVTPRRSQRPRLKIATLSHTATAAVASWNVVINRAR